MTSLTKMRQWFHCAFLGETMLFKPRLRFFISLTMNVSYIDQAMKIMILLCTHALIQASQTILNRWCWVNKD